MSEPSPVPALPLEIIGNIIDMLVDDDTNGLQHVKALSLTCQSFLPLCRKHIFFSVHVIITNTGMRYAHRSEEFDYLLRDTPVIARYIRRLEIRLDIVHPQPTVLYFPGYIPRLLTRLQSLVLVNEQREDPWYIKNWNSIPQLIQHSLQSLMHLPTLDSLDLIWIDDFPISSLITCTNIKHLSAQRLNITGENDDAGFSLSHKPMQLQSFEISLRYPEQLRLLAARCLDGRPVLDFTGLEKIIVRSPKAEMDPVVPIQDVFRRTQQLTDIHLSVKDTAFRAMEFAKMVTPSLQTLRRVHLGIVVNDESDILLARLCAELEGILGKNKLESVEIEFGVDSSYCHTGDEWGRLEKVLLKSGWPMLKHVSIVIYTWSQEVEVALQRLPRTQFTGLTSSKNLDFQFSVRG